MGESPADNPQFSDRALREWSGHIESVLRGVAHAMNNRAAALSAVLELSSEPDDDPGSTRSILSTELTRVRELAEAIRVVGPPRGGVEAFSPTDAAAVAATVLKLHADYRDRPTLIHADGVPPIRVARWMFVRALVALGATARKDVAGVSTPLTISMSADGDWLVVRVDDITATTEQLSPYAAELTRAMGGELLDFHGFRVPTLAAVRQREGR